MDKKIPNWVLKQKALAGQKYQTNCKQCGKETLAALSKKHENERRGGVYCQECRSKKSSETLKGIRAKQTKEERSLQAKKSNANRQNSSEAVKKQWETIKANPELYAKAKARLKNLANSNWDNYSEETRNRIITSWKKSTPRSKISEKFKQLMISSGIENFESEQLLFGFFPDELNQQLKVVVEFYGDYAHANPKIYKDPDEYITLCKRTVLEQWNRDRKRLGVFYKHGYTVIIVWESDYRKNPELQIQRIKDEISRKESNLIK